MKQAIFQCWQFWGVLGVVLVAAAEAHNFFWPERDAVQWLFFAPAMVCILVALALWDRPRR
ncbi:MAG: hypothetical protein OXR84_10160 [Magnetovibrio sp.]|nr:hypothetical protein [Magnetovibrio sp.]